MKRFVSVLATTAATAGVLLAVDSAADSAPPTDKARPTITITNLTFAGDLTVRPGATVKVVNNDGFSHTFTSNAAGKFDTGVIPAHSSKLFTAPRQARNYGAHCNIHSTMHTTLHVRVP